MYIALLSFLLALFLYIKVGIYRKIITVAMIIYLLYSDDLFSHLLFAVNASSSRQH